MIDPVDIHDELSKSTTRIENVIREEMAKISDILRQAIVDDTAKPCNTCDHYIPAAKRCLLDRCEYKPARVAWIGIPEACKNCRNHPINGGSGICNCVLGYSGSTDCSWK